MRRDTSWRMLLAAFFLLMLACGTAQAAIDPAKVQKLLAGDGAADDFFGNSVAVSGDTAVIGAYRDDDKGENSGAAYVFVRAADGTWIQQAKLLVSDGESWDQFGNSVALSGNTAVIGAAEDNDKGENSGSAYLFVRAADGTWTQQAKLLAQDGAEGDYFGASVDISDDTAVIGAHLSDDASGAAYVFIRAADGTWSQQAKLLAQDGEIGDIFGSKVAVSGNTAVIGAEWNNANDIFYSGAAYVFIRAADGTWSQQTKLTAADGADLDAFGTSVSVSGDTAVIGATGDDDKGDDSGSAYVFVRAADGTWSQQAKLLAQDGVEGDGFGVVDVSGDTAVIGAALDDDKGDASGSAYVFVRAVDGTWSQQKKLLAQDGAARDYFGASVAVSGDAAVIGASWDDDKGDDAGAAYVFGGTKVNMRSIYKLLL